MRDIVKSAIKATVGNSPYTDGKVSGWTNAIMENCLIALTKLQRPFKYISKLLTLSIMQMQFPNWKRKLHQLIASELFLWPSLISLFLVTCVILQRTGAGLQLASSCFWDPKLDGSYVHRFENDTMYIIVNVFGLAI